MTKQQIKEMMIDIINETLQNRGSEVLEEINEEKVREFMWSKDFGEEIANDYIEYYDIVNDYLEEIYEEITIDDLSSPF